MFNFICNIIVYVLIIKIIYKVVKKIIQKGKAIKEFAQNVQKQSDVMEREQNTQVIKITPEEHSFIYSQSFAIERFIKDRELGTYYTWKDRQEGVLCVYTPNRKGKLYYVEFEANRDNRAEIAAFTALDGSFIYDAAEEKNMTQAQFDKQYYNACVLNDVEYLNDIQNQMLNNGGEAVYDAKRPSNGEELTKEQIGYIAEALENYQFKIVEIDFDNYKITVRSASELDEESIEATEKEFDKDAFYKKRLRADMGHFTKLKEALLEGAIEAEYDGKRLNGGEIIPAEDLKSVRNAIESEGAYKIISINSETSLVRFGLASM